MENLIEYYLQQTENVHSAAEQLLENTRDLEESIGVSLSSRRYEVSKLELTLSIASFAVGLGRNWTQRAFTTRFRLNRIPCVEPRLSCVFDELCICFNTF